ncbi:unnamed protein product [Rhizophagus irregularis]|nr:unnamed protein product [Rhizophagus irregularis]
MNTRQKHNESEKEVIVEEDVRDKSEEEEEEKEEEDNDDNDNSKNTEDKIRLWDKSVKCLFLRVRNPSSEALDNLVVKIFRFKIYTSKARGYLDKTRSAPKKIRSDLDPQI